MAYSERYFIQMDPDLAEVRASVWGMDNTTTQIAVSVFVDRFLATVSGAMRYDFCSHHHS